MRCSDSNPDSNTYYQSLALDAGCERSRAPDSKRKCRSVGTSLLPNDLTEPWTGGPARVRCANRAGPSRS